MRSCFIHIGTPKTGTTAIQTALKQHAEGLARLGFLCPRTGTNGKVAAHHNIAFEIARNPTFIPENGCVNELLAEIAATSAHIILSSEAFDGALFHEKEFSNFLSALKQLGLRVKIIVYVKNQVDYARSLYLELLRHGYELGFNSYLNSILQFKELRWARWDWRFSFCYHDLMRRIEAVSGADYVIRSYDSLPDRSILADFLAIIGLQPQDLGIDTTLRYNQQLSLQTYLSLYYQNYRDTELKAGEAETLAAISEAFAGKHLALASATKDSIIQRFQESNARLVANYGLPPFVAMSAQASQPAHSPAETVYMEQLFSTGMIASLMQTLHPISW